MKASGRALFWILCAAAVGTVGCQGNDSTGSPGSGGQSNGSGGRSDSGSGGSTGSGGNTGSGGSIGSGGSSGSTGSGGATSSGGSTGSGGSIGSGGSSGSTGSGGAGSGTGGAATTASGGAQGASGGATGKAGQGGGSAAGGEPGAGGAGTAGAGGKPAGTGGAGGASAGGWVDITPVDETLKDASGVKWFPYLKGYTPGMDPLKTFRYDASTGYLVVSYADYPNSSFDNHLGLLYYDKKITNYKVRFEYHFKDPQAKNPPSWGKNNSGLFVFCTDPHMITGNPDFPTGIEIQLAGSPSGGGDVNCQICLNSTSSIFPAKIGSMNINGAGGCFRSMQSTSDFKTLNLAATWVTIETVVSTTGTTNVYQYTPDGMKPASPIQTFSAPVKAGSQTVTSQWLALQAESQPMEFRKIELMENP